MRSEYVVKSRDIYSVRMTALNRLLELTGIAEKNDAFRGLGHGEYIRK